MDRNIRYEPKPKFVENMSLLLKDKQDLDEYFKVAQTRPKKSIRVNTIKIIAENLKEKLEKKGWKLSTIASHPEILRIESELAPGELGKTHEHILGYYYVQEITSMMPVLALDPKPEEIVLDCCASPGSKTTQIAALMQNKGCLIANDVSIGRIAILAANLERCGVTNSIITRHDAIELANRLKKANMQFDKILIDAPCSGEGNARVSPRTFLEWSPGLINNLSGKQKKIASSIAQLLKPNGTLVYSTCTHSPKENEEVVQYLIDNCNLEIISCSLPIKSRPGITNWEGKEFDKNMILAHRIYHHDNDMEGFFLCKMRRKE